MREVEQTRGRGVERKKEKEEGAAMWGGSGVKKKKDVKTTLSNAQNVN